MIIGTCHFVSRQTAIRYYRAYEPYRTSIRLSMNKLVDQKLQDGEIKIGRPKVKPGDRVFINDEGRYCIRGS